MGKHRDWSAIEKDYREGDLSYAELAEKYNVSISTLKKAAARQGWRPGKGKAASIRRAAKALGKMEPSEMEPSSETEPEMEPKGTDDGYGIERFDYLVGAMAERIEQAIFRTAEDEKADLNAIKILVSALKDLRDLQHRNKSELDLEEQRARIEKLRAETAALKRQADKEQAFNEAVTVEFVDLEGAEL